MKRIARPRGRQSAAARGRSTALGHHTREAITRFVHLLAHCGIAPDDIPPQVSAACRRVPKSWAKKAKSTPAYLLHASHVLTLWFSNPKLLASDGKPRPLPLQGKEESIEALAQQVDTRLDARQVVRFLERAKALRRLGKRYEPRERTLELRGFYAADSFRKLRALLGMLRAFEHNQRPKREVPGWYEAFADNPRVPVRAIPTIDRKVRVQANKLLVQLDGDMYREERLRDPDEPTVRIAVGVYRFEEGPSPPEPRRRHVRRRKKTRRSR